MPKCIYTYPDGWKCGIECCGGRDMCYFHDKLTRGMFQTYPYTERRERAFSYYMTHGGTNTISGGWPALWTGLEMLCIVMKSSTLKALQKEQAILQHNDLLIRIGLRLRLNARVATGSK